MGVRVVFVPLCWELLPPLSPHGKKSKHIQPASFLKCFTPIFWVSLALAFVHMGLFCRTRWAASELKTTDWSKNKQKKQKK